MARTPKVVEDRRAQIIDAALRVFARKGYAGASNKDIAHEAGITPGLIYHYFESKEALLKAIIKLRSPAQVVRSLPPEAIELPPEMLLGLLARQILEIVEGEDFVRVMRVFLPEVIHDPEIAPVGLQTFQEAMTFLERVLAAWMKRGELRSTNAARTAQVFISCIMGFVLRRQILHDPKALQLTHQQIVDSVVGTLLNGLRPV